MGPVDLQVHGHHALFDFGVVGPEDPHGAVVVHFHGDLEAFLDRLDVLAPGPNQSADAVGGDLQLFHARHGVLEVRTLFADGLRHLAQDVQAALLGLGQRFLNDLTGDPGDLDVHLNGGHPCGGTGHFEVHVAQVIFVTQDVGQDLIASAVGDQPHGDTGDRCFYRDTRVHQGHGGGANRAHGRGAVGFQNFAGHADGITEDFRGRDHRFHGALGEVAVAQFATADAVAALGLTD